MSGFYAAANKPLTPIRSSSKKMFDFVVVHGAEPEMEEVFPQEPVGAVNDDVAAPVEQIQPIEGDSEPEILPQEPVDAIAVDEQTQSAQDHFPSFYAAASKPLTPIHSSSKKMFDFVVEREAEPEMEEVLPQEPVGPVNDDVAEQMQPAHDQIVQNDRNDENSSENDENSEPSDVGIFDEQSEVEDESETDEGSSDAPREELEESEPEESDADEAIEPIQAPNARTNQADMPEGVKQIIGMTLFAIILFCFAVMGNFSVRNFVVPTLSILVYTSLVLAVHLSVQYPNAPKKMDLFYKSKWGDVRTWPFVMLACGVIGWLLYHVFGKVFSEIVLYSVTAVGIFMILQQINR